VRHRKFCGKGVCFLAVYRFAIGRGSMTVGHRIESHWVRAIYEAQQNLLKSILGRQPIWFLTSGFSGFWIRQRCDDAIRMMAIIGL